MVSDSIFLTIKTMLGFSEEDDTFDTDILININSSIMRLNQLGLGPKEGYHITGKDETWNDYIGESKKLEATKLYIYERARLVIDPPSSSFVLEALKEDCKELEWRINSEIEYGDEVV